MVTKREMREMIRESIQTAHRRQRLHVAGDVAYSGYDLQGNNKSHGHAFGGRIRVKVRKVHG